MSEGCGKFWLREEGGKSNNVVFFGQERRPVILSKGLEFSHLG